MTKPTEHELTSFMEGYAPTAFELYDATPYPMNWRLEAVKMMDYFEEIAAPNGDWLRGKNKARVKCWKRTAQRWVRSTIERALESQQKSGRPAYNYTTPKPTKQTPEAARAALDWFNNRGRA